MKTLETQKILITDDQPENIMLLGNILKGYQKVIALNGEKALEIAVSENKPDLILLDVVMPGLDGFEVCKILKQNENTKDIPIIFITAKSEAEDETKGLEIGAADFITKPINPNVVLARVKYQLERKLYRENLQQTIETLAIQNKYITDSINYAKRIQTALLPSEETLNNFFENSFVIYMPKDIVSGDFYWQTKIDGKIIFAVGDCTGHGVPGAFMSMIGITLLNEIVNKNKIIDLSEILNELDKRIAEELQKEKDESTYDSIDMAICSYDEVSNVLEFGGAYRPLIYISENKLYEIKGEKKSLGDIKKKIKYASTKVKLNNVTNIYLFTDGFVDQHNSNNTRLGTVNLKPVLENIYKDNSEQQKEKLINLINNHKGNQIQRDDITLLSVTIPYVAHNILIFKGHFNNDAIVNLAEEFKQAALNLLSEKQIKNTLFCIIELLQNIYLYSDDYLINEDKKFVYGEITVKKINNYIVIKTINRAVKKQFEILNQKVNQLLKLNYAELLNLRNEIMHKKESELYSKGAGLGFIEILKRNNAKIELKQLNESEKNCDIEIKLNIKLEQ